MSSRRAPRSRDRRHRPWRVGLVLLPAILILGLHARAGTETGYGVSVVAGADTNPTLAAESGDDGALAAVVLDGAVYHTVGEKVELFVDGVVRSRLHSSEVRPADRDEAKLQAGLAFAPTPRSSLAFGALYQVYRGTYVDRATGEPYTYVAQPLGETVSLADRLDHDTAEIFADAQLRGPGRATFGLRAESRDADYVEDYEARENVWSLDYRSVSVEPRVGLVVVGNVWLWVSVAVADIDYADLPAVDADGLPVPGTSRSYRSTRLRAATRVDTNGWIWSVGAAAGAQDDSDAGYYDSSSSTVFASLSKDLRDGGRLRLFSSFDDVRYDSAIVPSPEERIVRGDELARLQAHYDRRLVRSLRWFTEGGVERADSRDPIYEYDRTWVMAGLELRR